MFGVFSKIDCISEVDDRVRADCTLPYVRRCVSFLNSGRWTTAELIYAYALNVTWLGQAVCTAATSEYEIR